MLHKGEVEYTEPWRFIGVHVGRFWSSQVVAMVGCVFMVSHWCGCCRAPMLHCLSSPQLFSEGNFHLMATQGAPIAVCQCQNRWGLLQAEKMNQSKDHTVTWLKQSRSRCLTKATVIALRFA